MGDARGRADPGRDEGQFTLGEMLQWANRRPSEVELVDGEFWFITAHLADAAADDDETQARAPRRSGTASTRQCPS